MRRTLFTFLFAIALVATGVVGAIAVGGTGTVDPPPKIAFLANGIVPADALAAGGIAGQLGAPLFTTPATSLNDDAKDGIKAYDPDLVIVLGGPVAINDSVLTALSAATGLPIVTTTAPDDGIVRVAGGDRYATARAVAGLLAAYDPAYLPVDATALGAVDADTLDGLDSTDFAASDQSCDPGEVVVEIDATGNVVCAPDNADGGDAETLDGLDSTDFTPALIANGETLVGFYGVAGGAEGGGEVMTAQIHFRTPLENGPQELGYVAVGEPAIPECAGSVAEPTADPGWLCIYEEFAESATLFLPLALEETMQYGFGLAYLTDASAIAATAGSYAVTPAAPTRSGAPRLHGFGDVASSWATAD